MSKITRMISAFAGGLLIGMGAENTSTLCVSIIGIILIYISTLKKMPLGEGEGLLK